MPEDAPFMVGFGFFSESGQDSIANEAAVREASSHLFNPTAFNNAADNLDRATEAVQEAARRKASRGDGDQADPDTFDFSEGHDFFL